ncbi:MAG: ParA family protein [Candidatus Rokubacteria bacterium]|nr:ParA family protein [Candidatus Rokubacteria bacterium]MBI3454858.1 ParA family protein [Candidatus Rokubacteria bacterium]
MKALATINFKGGVGKTTMVWCLGKVATEGRKANSVLMFDLDAQMSLTQAITLNVDSGMLEQRFQKWYDTAVERKKTIFHALDSYARPGAPHFDFGVGFDFIYKLSDRLHFVPSVEDLYWTELEVYDRDGVKDFMRRLLGKIENSKKVPRYDYCLFDCPPSFSLLSYSVLATCDLILIPVNPDFFASKGVNLILSTLRLRIEPHPVPKIGVFMNKGKTHGYPRFTYETQRYWDEVRRICDTAARRENLRVKCFDAKIPDRVSAKRAVTWGFVPGELIDPLQALWEEVRDYA